MSEPVIETLTFRPASEMPTANMDGMDVIVFNPCDGWHHAVVRVCEDDKGEEPPYISIDDHYYNELRPHEFYVAWALLPESLSFGDKFIDQKGPCWMFENKLV